MSDRLKISNEALVVLEKIQEQHSALIFHQSGGCCDGTAPMLLEKDEFYINDTDVFLGNIGNIPYYMSQDQFEYWKHTEITVDLVKGRGASFSLEIPLGVRFIIRSKLMES